MRLLRFRVTNFRSVEDSGWIDATNITALIGENESGKTNLLLALWKLHPANGEKVDLLSDAPRHRYHEIRQLSKKPTFVETVFELDESLVSRLVRITNAPADEVTIAEVGRRLDGIYSVGFPDANVAETVQSSDISDLIESTRNGIDSIIPKSAVEISLKNSVIAAMGEISLFMSGCGDEIDAGELRKIQEKLSFDETTLPKRSLILHQLGELNDKLSEIREQISRLNPQDIAEARELVRSALPHLVYYSDYGNLDSEIYLPHVIENLKRTDLGAKEQAKVRTLKVLFDFVRLRPEEILELGQEPDPSKGPITPTQIEESAKRKKEREILLQSASSDLTTKFRSWWQQGDYRFRFQADGNHFRIWVSDDRRPEEVELEGRSRGLQWFFSFYLVFLVESMQAHKGALLLLDEPGLSLHPLAQEDLSRFFENLSGTNQIVYTTHSPFLVDPNHLDRIKSVYVDESGKTIASANLRANEGSAGRSIQPVHAALNLSVSRTLLQGCIPILVEGQSDQTYLSAIKLILLRKGIIKPKSELVFVSVGGAKGVGPVVAILVGKDEQLPYVILDSDKVGLEMAKHLTSNIYKDSQEQVVTIDTVTGRPGDEIEDLFEPSIMARLISRSLPRTYEDFEDTIDTNKSLIPQLREFAKKHDFDLSDGLKVELSKQVKERLLQGRDTVDPQRLEMWAKLFLHL